MTYLPMWDGVSNSGVITDLLTYIPPRPFNGMYLWPKASKADHCRANKLPEIYPALLQPLEQSILSGAIDPYAMLSDFYSVLVPRWHHTMTTTTSHSVNSMNKSILTTLHDHIAQLASTALLSNNPTTAPGSILTFYERSAHSLTTTLSLISNNTNTTTSQFIPPAAIPPPHLFYSARV